MKEFLKKDKIVSTILFIEITAFFIVATFGFVLGAWAMYNKYFDYTKEYEIIPGTVTEIVETSEDESYFDGEIVCTRKIESFEIDVKLNNGEQTSFYQKYSCDYKVGDNIPIKKVYRIKNGLKEFYEYKISYN